MEGLLRYIYGLPLIYEEQPTYSEYEDEQETEKRRNCLSFWKGYDCAADTFGIPGLRKLAVDRIESVLEELLIDPTTRSVRDDNITSFELLVCGIRSVPQTVS